MNESMKQRHHVVIIGSGFGGLFATKALKDASVDVTVIAKTNHHLFQPLLYQVATGILSEGAIAPPTREILRGQRNAQVRLGEVTVRRFRFSGFIAWLNWLVIHLVYRGGLGTDRRGRGPLAHVERTDRRSPSVVTSQCAAC